MTSFFSGSLFSLVQVAVQVIEKIEPVRRIEAGQGMQYRSHFLAIWAVQPLDHTMKHGSQFGAPMKKGGDDVQPTEFVPKKARR